MASVGDKVIYNNFEGIVKEIYPVGDVRPIIIETYDGTLIKCYETEVDVIEDPEPDDGKITEDDFNRAVEKVLDSSNFEKMEKSSRTIVTVTGGMVCELLRRELFNKD